MAGFVNTGESVADIGADHGYLPLYLVREGVSPFAVLTDVAPGPLEKARTSVARAMAEPEKILLRQGDGLSVLKGAEVDVVVIAGMGGETICSILAADPEKAGSFRKYILQPRTKKEVLKDWLNNTGWSIISETAVEEKGRICDIIVCAPITGVR
jgi:tRNA (adenine22-N1)-methyltransferase